MNEQNNGNPNTQTEAPNNGVAAQAEYAKQSAASDTTSGSHRRERNGGSKSCSNCCSTCNDSCRNCNDCCGKCGDCFGDDCCCKIENCACSECACCDCACCDCCN